MHRIAHIVLVAIALQFAGGVRALTPPPPPYASVGVCVSVDPGTLEITPNGSRARHNFLAYVEPRVDASSPISVHVWRGLPIQSNSRIFRGAETENEIQLARTLLGEKLANLKRLSVVFEQSFTPPTCSTYMETKFNAQVAEEICGKRRDCAVECDTQLCEVK